MERAKSAVQKFIVRSSATATLPDAYHLTSPAPEANILLHEDGVCRNGGLNLEDVTYINACFCRRRATPETQAIENVFGDYAKKIAVSSL